MENVHKYEVDLNWSGDWKGILDGPGLKKTIEIATALGFPHGVEGTWSPEHLLVASVNSCYMLTFLALAEKFKLELVSFTSNAVGLVEKSEGKFSVTEITIKPVINVRTEAQKENTKIALEKTEKYCLIANSLKRP